MRSLEPLAMEGETIVFITDPHAGKGAYSIHYPGESGMTTDKPEAWRPRWDFTEAQHRAMGIDLDELSKRASVVAIGGDLIDWGYSPSAPNAAAGDPAGFIAASVQDAQFKAWLNARANLPKYLPTSGNHDLNSFNSRLDRTGDQWASAIGYAKYLTKPATGTGVQVIGLSQDTQTYDDGVAGGRGFALTDNPSNPLDTSTALGYMRSKLENGRPTWIMMHYPMRQHFSGTLYEPTQVALTDAITKYPNVIGVLSGHRHANVFTDANHAKVVNIVGNGKTVATAGINGAACGGQMGGTYEYPWDMPFVATVLTYRRGRVIVRWRDMIAREWIKSVGGVYSKDLAISCVA